MPRVDFQNGEGTAAEMPGIVMPTRLAEDRIAEEHCSGAVSGDMTEARRPETPNAPEHRDPLYLFACHLEWRSRRSVKAYQELVAALDDRNQQIRAAAETLLLRCSPRPQPKNADQQMGKNSSVCG